MRFKLFNGITNVVALGIPTVFNILDKTRAMPILVGTSNSSIIVVGKYQNSKLIAFPKDEFIKQLNQQNVSEKLANNFVEYLTEGTCKQYKKCYHSIDDYKKYIGLKNKVFGIAQNSVFNLSDLQVKIINNNWNIILTGTYWTQSVSLNISELLKLYGICVTQSMESTNWLIDGNICKNLTINDKPPCKPWT